VHFKYSYSLTYLLTPELTSWFCRFSAGDRRGIGVVLHH